MDVNALQESKSSWILDGYRYRRDRINRDDSVSWRCLRRRCAGRIRRFVDGESIMVREHNHESDAIDGETDNIRRLISIQEIEKKIDKVIRANKIKKSIEENECNLAATVGENEIKNIKPELTQHDIDTVENIHQVIFQNSSAATSIEAAQWLPSSSNLKDKRKRTHDVAFVSSLKTAQDVGIPERLKITTRADDFLLWDSGENDGQRILIFATQANIDTLEDNRHWLMDGNFKLAPEIGFQLLTIHALVNNHALPMVYVLMQSKREADYERVFHRILDNHSMLIPVKIYVDFERACFQVVSKMFPQASVVGCFFHLGQCLWHKIQDESLESNYIDDENVRTFAKMLLALSLLPQEDVTESFEDLSDSRPDILSPIYDYWEDTFIGRLRRIGRSSPVFPIPVWNMRASIEDGLLLANSSLEGWHNVFQSAVSSQRPDLYELIEHLRSEQNFTEQQLARLRTSSRSAMNLRLSELLPSYASKPKHTYLRDVALCIEL